MYPVSRFVFFLVGWLAVSAAPAVARTQAAAPVTLRDSLGRDLTRLRLPIFATGLAVEGAAIVSGELLSYFGAGHLLAKNWGPGVGFAASEAGLMAWRHALSGRIGPQDFRTYPIVNSDTLVTRTYGRSPARQWDLRKREFAYHTAYYVKMIDIAESYRSIHKRSPRATVGLDQTNLFRLAAAPVVPNDLASPWALVPIALAGASGFFQERSPRPLGEVESITIFGKQSSRGSAVFKQLGYDAGTLLSTALGEELFFRGLVQTEATERWGHKTGLTVSTLAFGAFHLPNKGVGGAAIATVAGAYFGHRYRKNGYKLGELVAMHFWVDFLPTAIQFLRDPRSGSSVYDVRWPARR